MARVLTGKVIANQADKTVTVAVSRIKQHRLYHKQYKATTKFLAHDEDNQCNVGDTVELHESRPISRRKRWTVAKVLTSADKGSQ